MINFLNNYRGIDVNRNALNKVLSLSLSQSLSLKGIALLALLAHHLFYHSGKYLDIHLSGNIYLVNQIGLICKICVPLFVFCQDILFFYKFVQAIEIYLSKN